MSSVFLLTRHILPELTRFTGDLKRGSEAVKIRMDVQSFKTLLKVQFSWIMNRC